MKPANRKTTLLEAAASNNPHGGCHKMTQGHHPASSINVASKRQKRLRHILYLLLILFIAAICFFSLYRYIRPRINRHIRNSEYIQNHAHAYDFPAENNGWKKFGASPVYGEGENIMFDPYCYVEDDTLKMLVSDRKNGALATVTSTDGVQWNDYELLLSGISQTWEDIVNRGCMIKHGDTYMLYYTGQHNGESHIGLAMSHDGNNFYRYEYNPILRPESNHEGASVMNPCVIYDKKSRLFKMWYSAGETYEPNIICYAESTDGINWVKRDQPVLEKGENEWEKDRIGGCQVIQQSTGYIMYYIGYQNIDIARICYAESQDGIHWKRTSGNLLLSPSEGSWDSCAVYKPSVASWHGQEHLYYNGRNEQGEYIGLAVKPL